MQSRHVQRTTKLALFTIVRSLSNSILARDCWRPKPCRSVQTTRAVQFREESYRHCGLRIKSNTAPYCPTFVHYIATFLCSARHESHCDGRRTLKMRKMCLFVFYFSRSRRRDRAREPTDGRRRCATVFYAAFDGADNLKSRVRGRTGNQPAPRSDPQAGHAAHCHKPPVGLKLYPLAEQCMCRKASSNKPATGPIPPFGARLAAARLDDRYRIIEDNGRRSSATVRETAISWVCSRTFMVSVLTVPRDATIETRAISSHRTLTTRQSYDESGRNAVCDSIINPLLSANACTALPGSTALPAIAATMRGRVVNRACQHHDRLACPGPDIISNRRSWVPCPRSPWACASTTSMPTSRPTLRVGARLSGHGTRCDRQRRESAPWTLSAPGKTEKTYRDSLSRNLRLSSSSAAAVTANSLFARAPAFYKHDG